MPFDPTKPQNGEIVDADLLRNQLNALHDQITVPKLPQYSNIAAPVVGNLAFDYTNHTVCFYDGQQWQFLD
jgi:hypothetical protein